MKEYFPHDYNARNDPKIENLLMEHGVAGIGVFWCIVEMLYEQDGKIPLAKTKAIAFALHVEHILVLSVINDFELFKSDEIDFWSDSIMRRIKNRSDVSEQRSRAAKKKWRRFREEKEGIYTNAENSDANAENSDANAGVFSANAMHEMCTCNAIKEKKRKEKENIYIKESSLHSDSLSENGISDEKELEENKIFREKTEKENLLLEEIRTFYNKKIIEHNSILPRAQSRFSNNRKKMTLARLNEYGMDKIKAVIEKSCASRYMNGSSGWSATFDWIMRPNNFIKILDGNYDNPNSEKSKGMMVGVKLDNNPDKYDNIVKW